MRFTALLLLAFPCAYGEMDLGVRLPHTVYSHSQGLVEFGAVHAIRVQFFGERNRNVVPPHHWEDHDIVQFQFLCEGRYGWELAEVFIHSDKGEIDGRGLRHRTA